MLKPQQRWKHFKISFRNVIFPKIQFYFKSKNLITRSRNILSGALQRLVQLVHVMKCLLSKLVSPVSLHVQSILQNLAYRFLESNLAIHLSAQTSC